MGSRIDFIIFILYNKRDPRSGLADCGFENRGLGFCSGAIFSLVWPCPKGINNHKNVKWDKNMIHDSFLRPVHERVYGQNDRSFINVGFSWAEQHQQLTFKLGPSI